MQINRLIEIVYLLLERGKVTAGELAERFEVSQRTIYRDVETLSGAGVPVYMQKGKAGGISLLPEFTLEKTFLSELEKQDVLATLAASASVLPEKATAATAKLKGLFGGGGDWIEVDFSNWSNETGQDELFELLKQAILTRRKVEFFYTGVNAEQTRRFAEPLKLCFKGQAWYLYARCDLRREFRFFKLARMREAKISQDPVLCPPPGKVLADLKPFRDEFVKLTLEIDSALAYRVYDEFPCAAQNKAGNFIVEASVPGGEWMYDILLSFKEHCRVLSPEWVREGMRERLTKMLQKYL